MLLIQCFDINIFLMRLISWIRFFFSKDCHAYDSCALCEWLFLIFFISMTVRDGLQRNIIMMRNKLEGRARALGKWLLLHNLATCGMKHLVITMMLLLDITTMEIQVCIFLHVSKC